MKFSIYCCFFVVVVVAAIVLILQNQKQVWPEMLMKTCGWEIKEAAMMGKKENFEVRGFCFPPVM